MIHRTDPSDVSKMITVYPIHDVEGPAAWFGRCPASQFIVPRLTDRAKQHLRESLASYGRQLVERLERAKPEATALRDDSLPDATWQQLFRDVFGSASPTKRSGRPEDDYFPGRPGDPPEPGRGERPGGSVPPGVDGESLGKGDE
jgi:hypothetical protein